MPKPTKESTSKRSKSSKKDEVSKSSSTSVSSTVSTSPDSREKRHALKRQQKSDARKKQSSKSTNFGLEKSKIELSEYPTDGSKTVAKPDPAGDESKKKMYLIGVIAVIGVSIVIIVGGIVVFIMKFKGKGLFNAKGKAVTPPQKPVNPKSNWTESPSEE